MLGSTHTNTKKRLAVQEWTGRNEIHTSGHLDIWTSGLLGIWTSEHLDFWTFGHLKIRTLTRALPSHYGETCRCHLIRCHIRAGRSPPLPVSELSSSTKGDGEGNGTLNQRQRRGQRHSALIYPMLALRSSNPGIHRERTSTRRHSVASFTPDSVLSPPCTLNLWGESTLAILDGAPASGDWEVRVQLRCHTCESTRVSRVCEAQKGKFDFSSLTTLLRPWPKKWAKMG